MTDLMLCEREQTALRRLLALIAVPGSLEISTEFLERISSVVPCDALGVAVTDDGHEIAYEITIPQSYQDLDGDICEPDSPMYVGILHWARIPKYAVGLKRVGLSDTVTVGFRNGDGVAQLWLDRRDRLFTDHDLDLLRLLTPMLQQGLRSRPTTRLPRTVTVQERRVLMLAAEGFSNAQAAERLCIAESTVRKHLEHAYRKLGVRNRVAAVNALRDGARNIA